MFPVYALIIAFVFGSISYGFKSSIDPDMGLFERTRKKALRSRLINWSLIYFLAVAIWWFQTPIKRFINDHQAERFIEQHRPQ